MNSLKLHLIIFSPRRRLLPHDDARRRRQREFLRRPSEILGQTQRARTRRFRRRFGAKLEKLDHQKLQVRRSRSGRLLLVRDHRERAERSGPDLALSVQGPILSLHRSGRSGFAAVFRGGRRADFAAGSLGRSDSVDFRLVSKVRSQLRRSSSRPIRNRKR